MFVVLRRFSLVTTALVGLSAVSQAQVTVRRPTGVPGAGAEESTRVTLALAVGDQRFEGAKQGRCTHAPMASIYNTRAAMWSIQYAASANSSLAVSVWRPIAGDTLPQLNFFVSGGGKTQKIVTVKGAEQAGKGTVQITKHGPGGRFDISGTTAEGAVVRGYIDCQKFAAPMAVGGN